jgi:hypothetical protein
MHSRSRLRTSSHGLRGVLAAVALAVGTWCGQASADEDKGDRSTVGDLRAGRKHKLPTTALDLRAYI